MFVPLEIGIVAGFVSAAAGVFHQEYKSNRRMRRLTDALRRAGEQGQGVVESALLVVFVAGALFLARGPVTNAARADAAHRTGSMCDNVTYNCATGMLRAPCPSGTYGTACDAYNAAH